MPPKRVASAVPNAAAAAPIDTSIKTITAIEKKLKDLKPKLYKKDPPALKQLHELRVQIQTIYDCKWTWLHYVRE
jgi:hypothetical protein